jgi:hypothetical protein
MMAAQLIAAHNAAMECYRRAMIDQQNPEARRENLAHAGKLSRTFATLLEALNRHRGKGQQKMTVEHVHVHSGGQAVVGMVGRSGAGGPCQNRGSTPCEANCRWTSAGDAVPIAGRPGSRANRQQCRTVDAGCTADDRRGRRRVTGTPLSMADTAPRRLPTGARWQSSFVLCALWPALPRRRVNSP